MLYGLELISFGEFFRFLFILIILFEIGVYMLDVVFIDLVIYMLLLVFIVLLIFGNLMKIMLLSKFCVCLEIFIVKILLFLGWIYLCVVV